MDSDGRQQGFELTSPVVELRSVVIRVIISKNPPRESVDILAHWKMERVQGVGSLLPEDVDCDKMLQDLYKTAGLEPGGDCVLTAQFDNDNLTSSVEVIEDASKLRVLLLQMQQTGEPSAVNCRSVVQLVLTVAPRNELAIAAAPATVGADERENEVPSMPALQGPEEAEMDSATA